MVYWLGLVAPLIFCATRCFRSHGVSDALGENDQLALGTRSEAGCHAAEAAGDPLRVTRTDGEMGVGERGFWGG